MEDKGFLDEVEIDTAIAFSFGLEELKSIAQSLSLKRSGTKAQLMERIKAAAPSKLELKYPIADWRRCSPKAMKILAAYDEWQKIKEDRDYEQRRRTRLKEMKQVGIEYCEILAANIEGGVCEKALALKGKKLKVSEAKLLPLPGCNAEKCLCDYCASLDK